jgi:hypothetical protein
MTLFEKPFEEKKFMKEFILFIIFSLLLIVNCIGVFAQQSQERKLTILRKNTTEPNKSIDLSQYKDWYKAEMGAYSFYVPKNFKLTKIRGVDATIWESKTENVNFGILEGTNVGLENPIKGYSSNVKYKSLLIEEVTAQMVFFVNNSEDYKYVSAISFMPPKWKISTVSITLYSKDVGGQELAKKIFESIRFNDTK